MSAKTKGNNQDSELRVEELYEYLNQLLIHFLVTKTDSLDTQWGTLSHQEGKVIKVLGQQGPCIMRQVADILGLALSTATGVVDRLVKKKLVYRQRSDEDRRIVLVGLTKGGKKIYDINKEKFMYLCRSTLGSLSEQEQKKFMSLIRKMIKTE